ncbi:MFS transporter [Neisseria zalophi]|uniref:MFS transporter n=1 Tax=Neisseria zalophi TaxID=640030 RepID=A0A5J6PSH2_9NEIS|nr:MFS transporter [Neisseria zalophi]QEY25306.1 MFS transporter [Neisseria zalophi]
MAEQSNKFYSLFFSVFFLFAGFGLFLNSAGVELSQMGVNNTAIGILNAAFFIGATLSAVVAHRVVSGVGHIRGFSVFGAIFAIAALGHTMTDNLWVWGVLRVLLGFCYYSLLMIVESWLVERSAAVARAKTLALYNVVYYISFTAGIGLLSFKLSSHDIFTLAAIMVMMAMLPVTMTGSKAPEQPPRQRISLPRLFAIAPLALVGSFVAGLLMNGFFTMASVFLLQQQFNVRQISFYLMIAMALGFVVQLPIARFSDHFGRRSAIGICSVISAVGAVTGIVLMFMGIQAMWIHYVTAVFFGIGLFTLYALSVARANDQIPHEMSTVEVSRSLLFSYGMGSLLAPIILGLTMDQIGRYGFYGYFIVFASILAVFAWRQQAVPEDRRSMHVNMPATAAGPAVADLDPRNDCGVTRPFDEEEAQAYANQIVQEQETAKPEPEPTV